MATGDQGDIADRQKSVVPPSWFSSSGDLAANPVLAAVLAMPASVGQWLYGFAAFAKLQTRLATATDGFLDLLAWDFFRGRVKRRPGQSDDAFRARVRAEILRPRATRPAIRQVLLDLTSREPKLFEPRRPADTGAYAEWGLVPGSSPTPLSMDAASLVVDTDGGAVLGSASARVGEIIYDTGQRAIAYTASATANSFVRVTYPLQAATYRVRVKVKRITGTGQTGEIINAAYDNGAGSVRAKFEAADIVGMDEAEASVVFTNVAPGTGSIFFLTGTTDAQWAIRDASITQVVDPAPYPTIVAEPASLAYGLAGVGGYGSLSIPKQVFVDVYRDASGGIPFVTGYGQPAGGYGGGNIRYASLDDIQGLITDEDLLAALLTSKAAGITVWVRIHS